MDLVRCYLCSATDFDRVQGKVRDRPTIGILRCGVCGLVFLDTFEHIDGDYYSAKYTDENHSDQSWDEVLTSARTDDERRASQLGSLVEGKRYLDVGCGAGGLLLNVRSRCSRAIGVEPQSRWRLALAEQGVEVYASVAETPEDTYDVISLFHVLEHIADPRQFLLGLKAKLALGGTMIIEVPNSEDALLHLYRSGPFSEFTYWSAHLYLYNSTNLELLLGQCGLRTSSGVEQFQRYPLANHLMWLSRGRPGGHVEWDFLRSPTLDEEYAAVLAARQQCDTLIARAMLC